MIVLLAWIAYTQTLVYWPWGRHVLPGGGDMLRHAHGRLTFAQLVIAIPTGQGLVIAALSILVSTTLPDSRGCTARAVIAKRNSRVT